MYICLIIDRDTVIWTSFLIDL